MVTLGLEGRKWEIFKSAVFAFAEQGYENVSMRQLAEMNHMQAASLYYHFESKEILLELMYEFYSKNVEAGSPDLNALLAKVPSHKPSEVLLQCINHFSEELQPLMDRIYTVALTQANRDERAYGLIRDNIFQHTKGFIQKLLQRMMDTGRIEPINIDDFIRLYTAFLFTGAARNYTPDPISLTSWFDSLKLLFSLIKEVPPDEEKNDD